MSRTLRSLDRHALLRWKEEIGPNGGRLCRWRGCQNEIPAKNRRRFWCGEKCVDEYMVRVSPASARSAVFRRDHGVCRQCGLETETLKSALEILRERTWSVADEEGRDLCWRGAARLAESYGYRRFRFGIALWEADHIVPVVEGGGGCGLDNLRTLCVPCHRRATKELAGRRAAARRPQKALPI